MDTPAFLAWYFALSFIVIGIAVITTAAMDAKHPGGNHIVPQH